jgi:hypothetical protein
MADFDLPDAGDQQPEPSGFEALPEPMETSDALTAFNTAWASKLNALREKEQEEERRVRSQAAEDMAKWTQQREIRLKAKKDANRSAEQVLLETLESEADPVGNTWERVLKLIPSDTEAADASKSDTKKMRSLMIQLKSEPPTGEGRPR